MRGKKNFEKCESKGKHKNSVLQVITKGNNNAVWITKSKKEAQGLR